MAEMKTLIQTQCSYRLVHRIWLFVILSSIRHVMDVVDDYLILDPGSQ